MTDTMGQEKPTVDVSRFDSDGSQIAVFEFQGEIRDVLLENLRSTMLATGSFAPDAKAVSPQTVMSLVAAGSGASGVALSAKMSETLFMATANPASLMALKSGGVGSAVMGPNGIVRHAGFVPIASSLPIVAPLMAMQTLSTIAVLREFRKVDQKLDLIKSTLDIAIARSEATHVGELLTASEILDEVYSHYDREGAFSHDMLARLALAERDVRRLAERFRYLVDSHEVGPLGQIPDVQRASFDAHSALLASFLDLRVAYLRVCVDMQEHPRCVDSSLAQMKAKIASVTVFWETLIHRSDELRRAIADAEKHLDELPWVEKVLPEFIGGRGAMAGQHLRVLQAAYVATMENELGIMKDFDELIHSARRTLQALDERNSAESGPSPTLVYWQDEDGRHSFYSSEVGIG